MDNSTVDFQARFSKNQEAVVSAFSRIGYRVMFSKDGTPKINRDKKEIYIPIIKDGAVPEIIRTIRGWVDHEMAHEICNSDHDLLKKASRLGKGMEMIFRLIEDGRVERIEANMLFGCKENLAFNEAGIIEKHRDSPALAMFVLAKYGAEKLKELGMGEILSRISPKAVDAVEKCGTCEEAYEASRKVYKDLKDREEEEKAKEKMDEARKEKAKRKKEKRDSEDSGDRSDGDKSDSGDTGDDGDSEESDSEDGESDDAEDGSEKPKKSKKPEKSKEKDGTESDDGSDDDDEHGADDGDESDDSDDDKEENGDGEDGPGEKESGGEGGSGDSDAHGDCSGSDSDKGKDSESREEPVDGHEDEELSEDEIDAIKEEAKAEAKKDVDEEFEGEKDISDSVVDDVKDSLKDAVDGDMGHTYIPYTKNDKIEDLTNPSVAEAYRIGAYSDRFDRDIMSDVNVLSQKLRLEMLATKMMKQRYKDSGFLDNRRIHILGMKANQENVFCDRLKKEGLNTAVTLLVDSSGSMHGTKVSIAKNIAQLMVMTMETLSIPCEVLSFTQDSSSMIFSDRDGRGYSRYHALRHFVHKPFDKRVKHCTRALNAIGVKLEQNADGESVLWAAARLSMRKEPRKILFVLSDGAPCNSESGMSTLASHLKDVVSLVSRHGIECVGIGIQTEVKEFYKNYVRIDNLSDVVRGAYAKIAESIRGARQGARR